MLYTLRQRLNRWRFYHAARKILDVAPIRNCNDAVRIVSSVSHMDLHMYLVALKTFHHFVPLGRPFILDDGTLTADDKAVLREHANPTDIVRLDDVPYRGPRKGVRWGILLTMAELAEDNYVLQLDSDTITRAQLPHVADAIATQTAFTLGTKMGTEVVPAPAVVDVVRASTSDHVQVVAEQSLERMPGYPDLKYVRGNSGLFGLGRRTLTRSGAEQFLEDMTRAAGQRWLDRGSFQVSANFVVANAPGGFVLPLDEYRFYKPGADLSKARFVHFIGTYRFVDDAYFRMAQDAVDMLALRMGAAA
jgi:hypothetical protein